MGEFQLNPKKETLKISALFFILFTATNSFLTILTFIYEQEQLTAIGPANIAVSYMAFIFSTTIAPSCNWKIKNQLLFGTLAYTLNFASGLFIPMVDIPFKFVLSCLGALVAGLSAGLLWVSQGRYIFLVCQLSGQDSHSLKAKSFGLFSLIYCLSHISAGLVTTFGLGLFDNEVYFMTVTATGLLSVIFCLILITDIDSFMKNGENSLQNPLKSQEIDHSNPESLQREESTSLREVFRYYPKMSSILWILVIDGLCYGIHISEITHMIPQDTPQEKLNLYAGFCNIALGCGASLGGWISGYIANRLGGKKSGNVGISMFLMGSALALISLAVQMLWLTIISVFFWGFFLFYIQGWLFIICSRQFKGRSQSFSVNKQLGSITCFLFQVIVIFTSNNFNLPITIGVVAVLSIPAFRALKKLPISENQQGSIPSTLSHEKIEEES